MKVLGVSGSLRSARYGSHSRLCEEITALGDENELRSFIKDQSKIHLQSFIEAGRAEGLAFDDLYRNLRKKGKDRGVSNSEAALVAALWGAHQNKCEIDYLCLATHMTPECEIKDKAALKARLLEADAIILSGPVYFGDRGSLAQSLFEFIRSDRDLRNHANGMIYAGLAVGAKRNGGQETTLIYQMIDACNLGMLTVGNGFETTAQYGGTALAGDVGTCGDDDYGFKTSLGTGRRVAEVLRLKHETPAEKIDTVQVGVWLLQDDLNGHGKRYAEQFCAEAEKEHKNVRFVIREITKEFVYRCIACDICPVSVGPVEEYRCIVKTESDYFVQHHESLVCDDAILLMAYSPEDMESIISKYQQFIERTRYLRRDNYVFSNRLTSALVISEIDANKNLHIRMLTSMIRHNAIIHKAMVGYEQKGALLNPGTISATLNDFVKAAKRLTAARLAHFQYESYQPVGYVISSESQKENERSGVIEQDRKARKERHTLERARRTSGAA